MNINKHILFDANDVPALAEYLNVNRIPFKRYGINNNLVIFDILQSSPFWPDINTFIEEYHINYLSETTFSKKELESASWLRVRSKWHCGYPQPEDNFEYQRITYTEDSYCSECGRGLRQIAPFQIKQLPKWGNRHFMMLNWVGDEIFLDDIAKNILQQNHTGFDFKEVRNKTGKDVVPGVYQLYDLSYTCPGFVEKQERIRDVLVCSKCNNVKYHSNEIGMYKFKREAFVDVPDICKSYEYFGCCNSAINLILIRQNVYRTIIDNHLERGLEFTPIELV